MSIKSILGLGDLTGKPKKSLTAEEILAIAEKKQVAKDKKAGKKPSKIKF